MVVAVSWGVVLTGLGAFLAGLGSAFSGYAALKLARKAKDETPKSVSGSSVSRSSTGRS